MLKTLFSFFVFQMFSCLVMLTCLNYLHTNLFEKNIVKFTTYQNKTPFLFEGGIQSILPLTV